MVVLHLLVEFTKNGESMKNVIVTTFCSLIALVAIDSVWLTLMSKRFYAPHLGDLLAKNIQMVPIVIFYLLYALGVTIFVVNPAIEGSFGLAKLFFFGAFFGLVAYGAYDFTNQATLQNWPVIITIVDLAWGSVLTGFVAVIAAKMACYFLSK